MPGPRWPIAAHSPFFMLLIGLITILPPLAIDMGLPALGAIGQALGHNAADATLTLSFFMLGFAVSPLAYGPLSDRFGRRPVILWAVALFAVGGIGCTLAGSLPNLLFWRLVQGAGAGASLTLPLAIVRDLFDGAEGRTKLSHMIVLTIMAPMVAPTLGAGVLALGGWRAIYGVLGVAGALAALGMGLCFAESARIDPARRLSLAGLLADYGTVLRNRLSLGYILVNSLAFGTLFAYVSASPLLLIDVMGISPTAYGLVFALTSFGIMAGAFVSGRLSARNIGLEGPLAVGLALSIGTALLLLALTLAQVLTLPVLLPLLALGTFGAGLIFPNAAHGAIQPLPQIAGVASAVMGCSQMTVGAISSAMVAGLHDGRSGLAMTGVMAFFGLLTLACLLLVVRPARRGTAPVAC